MVEVETGLNVAGNIAGVTISIKLDGAVLRQNKITVRSTVKVHDLKKEGVFWRGNIDN